jgi:cytochrome bd ubiquinol oxidase subunit II
VFAGATWDFFGHGYAVLTGLLTITLFSLAGATRLQAKTDGALRDQMGAIVRPLTLATVGGVAISAALLPVATSAQLHLGGIDRWLPFGYAVLVAAAGFWTVYQRAGRPPDWIPFAAVAAAEAAGLVALLALFYPQIVPPSVTLYSSAASRETIDFLVIAIGVLLPLTIAYHAYANWVFRGRQPLDDAVVPHGLATARGVIRSVAPGHRAAPSRLPGAQPAEGGH